MIHKSHRLTYERKRTRSRERSGNELRNAKCRVCREEGGRIWKKHVISREDRMRWSLSRGGD